MAVGIPRYRLPADILQRDIDDIVALPGVTLHLNTPVRSERHGRAGTGPSLESLRSEYDAVFVGVGTHDSVRMRIPGEELGGVLHGAEYLRQLSLAQLGADGVRRARRWARAWPSSAAATWPSTRP